jgi:hypothetical protein
MTGTNRLAQALRVPPLGRRSPLDHVKWLVAYLAGVALAAFVIWPGNGGLFVVAAITGTVLVLLLIAAGALRGRGRDQGPPG